MCMDVLLDKIGNGGGMETYDDFESELNAEVAKRLEMMEEPGYEFSERMRKGDFIAAGVLIALALAIVEIATLTAGVM